MKRASEEEKPYLSRRTIIRKRQKIATSSSHQEDTSPQMVAVARKKIPLASENFKTIIELGMLYVDKTDIIQQLLEEQSPRAILIARPKKFGKSLVMDIIYHILRGEKELFKGLKIYEQRTNWTRYAIVRLNFAFLPDIGLSLLNGVKEVAKEFNIAIDVPPSNSEFIEVLDYFQRVRKAISNLGIQIAVIVDEYDLPIVQYLENKSDDYQKCITESAQQLNKLFNHIKNDITGSISYFIVTGVANFAKTGLFSAANQLQDVSMSDRLATLYGYTPSELETYFRPQLIELARRKNTTVEHLVASIIQYYNGYCFSFENSVTVLNPYDINKLLSEQSTTFESYWINEGQPRNFGSEPWASNIDISYWQNCPISKTNLVFEPCLKSTEEFLPAAFFVQVGLLTIRHENQMVLLDVPNNGIRLSFCQALVSTHVTRNMLLQYAERCSNYIANNDPEKFKEQLISFFACLPFSSMYNIAKYESYYHTCTYLLMSLMDLEVTCQNWTNTGIIDLVVIQDTFIWIIELKINEQEGIGLDQKKNYYEKYLNLNKQIECMEIIINKKDKNVGINRKQDESLDSENASLHKIMK